MSPCHPSAGSAKADQPSLSLFSSLQGVQAVTRFCSTRFQPPIDCVPLVMGVALDEKVPLEVRRTFVFAQGALCYGHWYYPLLTLISHDLLRIADFAMVAACRERQIGARTFEKRIAALITAGAISAQDEQMWTELRKERDRATHPASQSIYGFSMAFDVLKVVRELINRIDWLPS